jgi:hypothetical protein
MVNNTLSDEIVRQIRNQYRLGITITKIAQVHNLPIEVIRKIVSGPAWQYQPD